MPVHDWSRVEHGIFHDFHHAWIAEIRKTLNKGVLPPDYYALSEQYAGSWGPDVLTLHSNGKQPSPRANGGGTVAPTVAVAPPKVRLVATTEMEHYAAKQKTVVIRHSSDDRVVAMIEVVSPGNKSSRHGLDKFVAKACDCLQRGIHLLIIDLLPTTPRDPQGVHGTIWSEIEGGDYVAPADKPLTLVSYSADSLKTAYIEPIAVGDILCAMPLFGRGILRACPARSHLPRGVVRRPAAMEGRIGMKEKTPTRRRGLRLSPCSLTPSP